MKEWKNGDSWPECILDGLARCIQLHQYKLRLPPTFGTSFHASPLKMDRSRAAYFSQEEQVVIMESYEEYKNIIMTKSNTVSSNNAREECWQKIANVKWIL